GTGRAGCQMQGGGEDGPAGRTRGKVIRSLAGHMTACWIAGLLALGVGVGINTMERVCPQLTLPPGVASPGLAVQLVRSQKELDQIIVMPDKCPTTRESLKREQYVDFGFIATYTSFFALTATLLVCHVPRCR